MQKKNHEELLVSLQLERKMFQNELSRQETMSERVIVRKDLQKCERKIKELTEQLQNDKSKNEEISQELGIQKKELEDRIAETEEEHNELSRRREKIVKNIDKPNLALYDRVRGAREGVAVVSIVNHACGGCHSRIPSQLDADIRSGDKMTQCNSCRRILYWEKAEVPS